MPLPILFHRTRRYNGGTTYIGSGRSSRHSTHGGRPKLPRVGCGGPLLWLLLLAVLAAVWMLWYMYPVSEAETGAARARVVVETRYVIMDDTTEVMAFADTRGDTLMAGIGQAQRDTVTAYRIKRWNWLPYCGGTFAIPLQPDTGDIVKWTPAQVAALLQNEARNVADGQQVAAEQRSDVDYYLKTHTVTDNGFSIVERYSRALTLATDSIRRLAKTLADIRNRQPSLQIRMERRYRLLADTAMECMPAGRHDSIQELRTRDSYFGQYAEGIMRWVPTVRLSAAKAHDLLARELRNRRAPRMAHIDSVGTYTGARDSVMRPHGYGRFISAHGDFYEGEWKHGKCDGVGFSMIRGQRLQLGEWKENRFLGERITYTPDRVYGIDISRYQHEKGRRRFAINWRNLRITSLGTASKKNISGRVDYPVSFVYIKATEGMTVKNPYFAADYAASRKSGHRTGAYHFFSLRTPARNQAAFFMRNSRYAKGDLPPVLDLEPTDAQIRQAGGVKHMFSEVRAWLKAVQFIRNVKPVLYVSQRFVNKYLPKAPDIMKNYDVWIARYGEYKPDVRLLYWQLCQDGRVSGIHGTVDINVYNGGLAVDKNK